MNLGQFFLQVFFTQGVENASPHAPLAPAVETLPNAVGLAEPLGQVFPGHARLQHVQHRVDEQAVVLRPATRIALLAGEQALDRFPLVVTQRVSLEHRRSSIHEVNSPKHRRYERITRDECPYSLVLV